MSFRETAKPWGVHDIGDVIAPRHTSVELADGKWGRVVPEPYHGNRLHAAWWVLTGKAFALKWPTNEDLNRALERRDY